MRHLRHLPRRGRHLAVVALALLACAACAAPRASLAGTVYAPGGLGEPTLEEGARIRALGGAGVAEYGPTQFSLVNPASMAAVQNLTIQGTILPSYRRISATDAASENSSETIVPMVRTAVRLPKGFVLGAAYAEGTDGRFSADRPESAGTASTLHIDGAGGLQSIRISLARSLGSTFRLGLDHEIIAGYYREEWNRRFADTLFTPSRDTLEVRYQRLGRWRLGGQAAFKGWTLGLVYETERRLPLYTLLRAAGTSVQVSGKNLRIPSGWVVGASGNPSPRWHVAAQYRRANWNRESLESDLVDFRAMTRYSVGVERLSLSSDVSKKWFNRLPIRLGFSYLQWPDLLPLAGQSSIAGGTAAVNETTFSLGTGIISQDKLGGIDFTLEAGKRGNKDELGVDERFVRAAITLQVGDDTWKSGGAAAPGRGGRGR